jgi:hypothetical protein
MGMGRVRTSVVKSCHDAPQQGNVFWEAIVGRAWQWPTQIFWRRHSCLAILTAMSDVTRILSQIEEGNLQAAERLLPLLYDELRNL